jgi:hypothetical protein
MHNRSQHETEETGGYVVPVAPTITDRQKELVAEVARKVHESGKVIDRQFPDVLGGVATEQTVAFEQ